MTVRDCLQPGDCLLYRPDSLEGWLSRNWAVAVEPL